MRRRMLTESISTPNKLSRLRSSLRDMGSAAVAFSRGLAYVTLDLLDYRTGSMNERLSPHDIR